MDKEDDGYFFCKVNGAVKVAVKVAGPKWSAVWKRKFQIDFDCFKLPSVMIVVAKQYLRFRLSTCAPHCMESTRQLLRFFSENWMSSWADLSDIKLIELMALWNLPSAKKGRVIKLEIKRFYRYCSENEVAGADIFVAGEIEGWSATLDSPYYKNMLMWHEEKGAMTSSEQELLRQTLISEHERETVSDQFTRIFLWACFETVKRPSQILEMKSDALVEVAGTGGQREYFLRIPKSKRQLGRQPELWPISNLLASEIVKYSSNEQVSRSQLRLGLLLVRDGRQKVHPVYNTSEIISRWVRKREIISQRTNKLLVVTPYRIRHTGATALAMQGVSSAEIQYILEHDSAGAAQIYIDAIGSELAPLLRKVDRKVGYIFTRLNEEFFKGSVQKELLGKRILIPIVEVPAVVGSCGFNGRCDKHPFFQCYNGCKHFIAWAAADHSKSLEYINNELERWELSEGITERSKAIKDFEQVGSAIKDVIRRIGK